ncbi:hypothetical protein [Mucilaginibacter ginsenosidivorans]|uniref:G8 domain-containing protein n=1 Tax=Mucilaginibacter ginsenosidivorans TaxID=398053 RepID=A0A5B8UUU3_9SPHI|nr:hypothetical protein [Mucilaginibacter ginsenosidivorans]QEC62545.1 hypothetical protein FRZ54_08060 [Mucilaginibacter ginsenosidivorans]
MNTSQLTRRTIFTGLRVFCPGPRYRAACCLFFTLLLTIARSGAATLVWTGAAGTDWANAANWSPQQVPGSGDAVQIGFTGFVNQPALSQNAQCASLAFGNRQAVTLTISGSLNVSGAITLAHSDDDFIPHATVTGTGTLTCTSLLIGDGVFSKLVLSKTTLFSTSLTNFTVNGNATVNSVTMFLLSGGVAHNHGRLSLEGGLLTITGQIRLTNNIPSFLAGHIDGYLPSASFLIDVSTADARLKLPGNPAIHIGNPAGDTVDFYTYGETQDGGSTVEYAGGDQVVSTRSTPGMDRLPAVYQNLIISGSGTKVTENASGDTLDTEGYLTISAGALDLQANHAFLSTGGDFNNRATTRLAKARFYGTLFLNAGTFSTTPDTLSFLKAGQQLRDSTADGTTITTAYLKTGSKTIVGGRFIIPPGGSWTVADNATQLQVSPNAELVLRADGTGDPALIFLGINQNLVAAARQSPVTGPVNLKGRIAAATAKGAARRPLLATTGRQTLAPPQVLTLSLLHEGAVSLPLVIRFDAGAQPSYSPGEDQLYRKAAGPGPEAWSYSSDHKPLTQNTLPLHTGKTVISLFCGGASGGAYTWQINGAAGLPPGYTIRLLDKLTGKSADLKTTAHYHFSTARGNPASYGSRFELLITRQDGQ